MKYFLNDIAVRIWREEREGLPEYAHFYKGIFEVMMIDMVHATFIPTLPRTPDKWPPVLPPNVNVDIVESEEQARLFTVLFSDYIVTPNAELARLSQIKHFESMKFILNQIRPFARELHTNGYTLPKNGTLFHDNREVILTKNGTKIERQLNGFHHQIPQVAGAVVSI